MCREGASDPPDALLASSRITGSAEHQDHLDCKAQAATYLPACCLVYSAACRRVGRLFPLRKEGSINASSAIMAN